MSNMMVDETGERVRVPPQAIEAEQSVLGGLLLDNSAFDSIAGILVGGDFYRHDHRIIFEHIGKLIAATRPADMLTVFEALGASGKADDVGGLAYLNKITQNTPSAANIRRYAEIVRDRAVLRRLIAVHEKAIADCFNPQGKEVSKIVDESEAAILAVREQGATAAGGFEEIGPILAREVARIDAAYDNPNQGDVTGIATGYLDLDKMTAGMQDGELIVICGRPAMGKSSLSTNIGEFVATELGLPVAVFSLEMPGQQCVGRMIASQGRIDAGRIKTGRLEGQSGDGDWPKLTYAMQKLSEAPIYIDESGTLSPLEIRARARRLNRQVSQQGKKLGVIIVDHIQLCDGSSGSQNRAQEVSEITRSLKQLAKELGCVVIALSQLNRGLEQRPDKRPRASDLKESGSVEQDADQIWAVYRDEVYAPDTPDRGTAEIIILKNRSGATGTVRLAWRGQYTRFDNFIGAQGAYSS
jgi:replicative DNA helicase